MEQNVQIHAPNLYARLTFTSARKRVQASCPLCSCLVCLARRSAAALEREKRRLQIPVSGGAGEARIESSGLSGQRASVGHGVVNRLEAIALAVDR